MAKRRRRIPGGVPKGVMKPLENVLKDGKELGDEAASAGQKGAGGIPSYKPAPSSIPGVPGLRRARPKTSVKGGGGLRKRWTDRDGNIYEWDSQHGALEKYDRRGKHLREYNPETGQQNKPGDPSRSVEP